MSDPECKPRLETIRGWLWQIFCGMCMGAADLVPGISGGTVAFIMGIYEGLIGSLKTFNPTTFSLLLRFRFKDFFNAFAWEFLVALILGASCSFFMFAELFDDILNHEEYRVSLYSAFMGLILASALFCARQVKSWDWRKYAALVLGGGIAFILTGTGLALPALEGEYGVHIPRERTYNPSGKPILNYHEGDQILIGVSSETLKAMLSRGVVDPTTRVYKSDLNYYKVAGESVKDEDERPRISVSMVFSGAVAICAMLLPGVSGSYLLTILGVYPTVIGALADLTKGLKSMQFDSEAFFILLSLGLGIMLGAISFARVLSWVLKHYHDITVALLTGFMLGALRSVWPYWSYAYELVPLRLEKGPQIIIVDPLLPDITSMASWVSFGFLILGFTAVFIIDGLAKMRQRFAD